MQEPKKLMRARVQLLIDHPFWATVAMRLRWQADPSIPTMATDGTRLIYSPAAIEAWPVEGIRTVIVHECMHVALAHHIRRGARDPRKWNIACDYAVNLMIDEYSRANGNSLPFPPGVQVLLDAQLAGMSAEEIYSKLPDDPAGGDEPGPGDVQDIADRTPAGQQAAEGELKVLMTQAATIAKGQGQLPAQWSKLIDGLLNPVVSWREVLRRFARATAADDYHWNVPNRRYAHSGFILPSLRSERVGCIVVVKDTSGSTMDWQEEILAELSGILHEVRPERVIVIDCDADVQRVAELQPGDALPTDAIGGGGTDFRPALLKAAEFSPDCCVYLTDLWGEFPSEAPAFPVLWATDTKGYEVPFGELILIH